MEIACLYEEVENTGQATISILWVSKTKMTGGNVLVILRKQGNSKWINQQVLENVLE